MYESSIDSGCWIEMRTSCDGSGGSNLEIQIPKLDSNLEILQENLSKSALEQVLVHHSEINQH